MVQDVKEQIKHTNDYLRKQTIHEILEQFDGQIMLLSKKNRRAKYAKMKEDAYSFFRGSIFLFYYDVTKIPFSYHTTEDKPAWILGDLHFDNLSAFQNEDGDIVFDVDDFDEGYFGSYLYDVLRMVVSIRLVAEKQGFDEDEQDKLVKIYLKKYYQHLKKFLKGDKDPVTRQFTMDNTKGPIKQTLEKLVNRDATRKLEKQTYINEQGERKFNREKTKLDNVSSNEYKEIIKVWDNYLNSLNKETFQGKAHYKIKDIVKKTGAGIGSTGLKRFYILIDGQNENDNHDCVLLEAKEARTSVAAYFCAYNETFWDENDHQGKRVISTQKAMHHKADPYLGYFSIKNRQFYVRERSAYEEDLDTTNLDDYKELKRTLKTMGKVTAKIHARADVDIEHGILDYHGEEEILKAIGDDKKGFKKEMVKWSKFYKERVEKDYILFQQWLEEYFYKG
ncbi:hypothetical protein GCM10011351_07830 [Paraliobacillus quinghaiensis]|uniref:DUF2252 domain-containing protein n=1 Tax=Paraliobacillus quinghaiensis TaxID=470815 RepID=A0A917WR46_9BACI|nr:DUF2252 family protein [Paraliobacillus quinghaiensis]GGM24496.1 hypothetical protein GCM10011351_07830 [Paraliobacillus quinghaiensis]